MTARSQTPGGDSNITDASAFPPKILNYLVLGGTQDQGLFLFCCCFVCLFVFSKIRFLQRFLHADRVENYWLRPKYVPIYPAALCWELGKGLPPPLFITPLQHPPPKSR